MGLVYNHYRRNHFPNHRGRVFECSYEGGIYRSTREIQNRIVKANSREAIVGLRVLARG